MATPIRREVVESPLFQGADETIVYKITTTPWASNITTLSSKIYSYSFADGSYTDVTSANMTGSTTSSGDVVTLPAIAGLSANIRYRVEVKFSSSGNTFEPYFWIYGQR